MRIHFFSYMGIERTSFIIGKDGKIERIFPKVKVEGHNEEVLAAIGYVAQAGTVALPPPPSRFYRESPPSSPRIL